MRRPFVAGNWKMNLTRSECVELAAGIVEGLFVFILANTLLPLGGSPIMFGLHYAAVWIATFLASQSLMRLLFPRWRYRGGQWI